MLPPKKKNIRIKHIFIKTHNGVCFFSHQGAQENKIREDVPGDARPDLRIGKGGTGGRQTLHLPVLLGLYR